MKPGSGRGTKNRIGIRLSPQAERAPIGVKISPRAKRIVINAERRYVARIRRNLVGLSLGIKRNKRLWKGLSSREGLRREVLDKIMGSNLGGRGVAALEEMHIIVNTMRE